MLGFSWLLSFAVARDDVATSSSMGLSGRDPGVLGRLAGVMGRLGDGAVSTVDDARAASIFETGLCACLAASSLGLLDHVSAVPPSTLVHVKRS